jgi:hypothetical protein
VKFVLVVVLIAIAIYLTVRVIERRGVSRPTRPPQRPHGPDDDPDFLRGLGN